MTGFGSAEQVTEQYSLKIEIKSLNSKFFDPILKIQKEMTAWELEIRSLLEKGLKRGKVNCSIDFESNGSNENSIRVNEVLFATLLEKLKVLAASSGYGEEDLFKLVLSMPQVIENEDQTGDLPISFDEINSLLQKAIASCRQFRQDEGNKLRDALVSSKDQIQAGLDQIEVLDPERVANVRSRLTHSIEEIRDRVQIDENRFEQELIFYIEKLDITEEKVRLRSHLRYMEEVIDQAEPSGKKLGFLSQEIGREINTIGSKANHAEIQRIIVSMKEELEKIKEQVLNVL